MRKQAYLWLNKKTKMKNSSGITNRTRRNARIAFILCSIKTDVGRHYQLRGKIIRLYAPDKNGKFIDDVVICFRYAFNEVIEKEIYFGAVCGRVANRIKDGKFSTRWCWISASC